MPNGRLGRRGLAATGACLLLIVFATVASAAHWPFYGGDAGRSGYQPVNEGFPPIARDWLNATDKKIVTSVVTSGAPAADDRRVIYGTEDTAAGSDGNVHIQRLGDGAPVGSEVGADVESGGNDTDTFQGVAANAGGASANPQPPGSVTPVSSSAGTSFGQIFALHNDDNQDGFVPAQVGGAPDPRSGNDIAIAQIDETTGNAYVDKGIGGPADGFGSNYDPKKPNTINYTISSSPLLVAGPGSTRSLYFVAARASASAQQSEFPCVPGTQFDEPPNQAGLRGCDISAKTTLFRIDISNANTQSASFTPADIKWVDVPSGNSLASPTQVNLDVNPDGTQIAVGTTNGNLIFYDADDLTQVSNAAVPKYTVAVGGAQVNTASVPVTAGGALPDPAPAIFVASNNVRASSSTPASRVHRIARDPDDATKLKVIQSSGTLIGEAAPALAVSAEAGATNGSLSDGRVLLTTANNLYSLDAKDLTRGTFLNLASDRVRGTTGFSRTTAAVSGGVAYASTDNGEQLARDERTLDPVEFTPFTTAEDPGPPVVPAQNPLAANAAIGQPSIASRKVTFGNVNGSYTYLASPPPTPTPGVNGPGFSVNDVTVAEGNSGTVNATFTVTKTGPGAGTVTAQTANGSATAGSDYTAAGPTVVSFTAGETTKSFTVPVTGDTTFEGDETFVVNLSAPTGTNAAIADGQGLGVITDDDQRPTSEATNRLLSIGDVTVLEGTGADGKAILTLTLSNASSTPVTVTAASANDSATAVADYRAFSGTVTFAPGETSKSLLISAIGDSIDEPTERFLVNLSNAGGATIADGQGAVLIIDDDGTSPYAPKKVNPRSITATVRPTRDRKAPFRFTTTGRLLLPTGMTRAQGCSGRVQVQVKAARKTISTRRVALRSTCSYRSTVTFRNRKRFTRNGRLTFSIRFLGNERLNRKNAARRITVRTK